MKKILSAAALALVGVTTPAFAELEKVYACQYTDSTGFIFKAGKWQETTFNLGQPFFIKTDGVTITSTGVLFDHRISCTNAVSVYQCGDQLGGSVIFDSETKKGAHSELVGAASVGDERDTVTVSLFVCDEM